MNIIIILFNEVALSSNLIKSHTDKFITGTDVIKKSNFSDHVKKSVSYLNREWLKINILEHLQVKPRFDYVNGMNQKLKDQLIMRFQLAHFTIIHGTLFKWYSYIANFEKDVHNVDLGNSYLTDTPCHEMLHFLSKSIVKNNIAKPLINGGTRRYYSVHNDGSSSTKTRDDKELYLSSKLHIRGKLNSALCH